MRPTARPRWRWWIKLRRNPVGMLGAILVVFVLLVPRGIVPSLGDVIEAAWRRRKPPVDKQADAAAQPQAENAR